DARAGVTTGISAAERARTIRLLADPEAKAEDLTRPGHVFPLRAKEGGVLRRRARADADLDRRPRRAPDAHRAAGAPGRRGQAADPARRVHRDGIRLRPGRHRARRAG